MNLEFIVTLAEYIQGVGAVGVSHALRWGYVTTMIAIAFAERSRKRLMLVDPRRALDSPWNGNGLTPRSQLGFYQAR